MPTVEQIPAKPAENPVHLVLAGGGMRCLSYAGALSVLAENGITFARVTGVSGGTLAGALLCAGVTPQEIERLTETVSLKSVAGQPALPAWLDALRLVGLRKWPFATYRQPGFPGVFRELLGRDPTFSELRIPFATAGVDIISHRFLVYSSETHPDMRVSAALEIAVSLPLVYPPYEPPGRIVIDAGIVSECPVWMAAGRGDDLPIVALRPCNPSLTAKPRGWLAYLAESINSASRIRDDYFISQMPRVRLIEIDCGDIRGHQTDISDEGKRYLIGAGRVAAENALQRYGRDLGSVAEAAVAMPRGHGQDDVAEASGTQLMIRFNHDLSRAVRNQIFISYSHEDKKWLERLQLHLKPLLRNTAIRAWDDTNIPVGEAWQEEIEQALAASRVAVILITPEFLASDYIADRELPCILAEQERGHLKVVPIVVRPSVIAETALSKLQAAEDLKRPLSSLEKDKCDQELVAVCTKIKKMMQAA